MTTETIDHTNGEVRSTEPEVALSTNKVGSYFYTKKDENLFIRSGSTLLDCVLGGGWKKSRVCNISGNKSTGKTQLVIEAMANFQRQYDDQAHYAEAEAAWDDPYAKALGLRLDRITFKDPPIRTIEEWAADIEKVANEAIKKKKQPFYALDSLDALSADAELARKMDDPTYGTEKARKMGELFRRLIRPIEESGMTLMVISQIRDNMDGYGASYKISGGHALDFYASQRMHLTSKGQLKRTVNYVERAYGISVEAMNTKNKVGMPYRWCNFDILFGYGIDDYMSMMDWLVEVVRCDVVGYQGTRSDTKAQKAFMTQKVKETVAMPNDEYLAKTKELSQIVSKVWFEIEESFAPTHQKYT